MIFYLFLSTYLNIKVWNKLNLYLKIKFDILLKKEEKY